MDAPSLRLLVVEDDPGLLRLVVRVLEREGLEVHTETRGDEALRWIDGGAGRFDVAVLDMAVVPGGAGPVLEGLRRHRPEAAVVVTSGDVLDPALRGPLERAAGVFLRKPFDARALVRAVHRALDAAQREGAARGAAAEGGEA